MKLTSHTTNFVICDIVFFFLCAQYWAVLGISQTGQQDSQIPQLLDGTYSHLQEELISKS